MALIVCPECKKEVSDQAKTCPNCGYPFQTAPSLVNTPVVEAATEAALTPEKKKRKWIALVAVSILVVVGICIGLVVRQNMAQNTRKEYIENLTLARNYMLQGGAEAESTCNLIKSVWYNTIYEKNDITTDEYTKTLHGFHDDFNDSLRALYESDTYNQSVITITASQNLVDEQMKKLQSPPDDLRDCYDTLNDLYGEYSEFTSMATNPSGSLQTYSEALASCDSSFMKTYDKLGTQIPEE